MPSMHFRGDYGQQDLLAWLSLPRLGALQGPGWGPAQSRASLTLDGKSKL